MLDESYIVEKSKPLVWAKFKDYGVGELKILDTYLSRINARDPASSMVTFSKKEYAELMGLDPDIRTSQLKGYTSRLLSNVVTIDLPDHGFVQYPLFSEAKCYLDKEVGQVMINIECNEKLKDAFFGIAQNGYIKYQLKNIIALGSQYSMRLYPWLKDRPMGWTVELEELRKMLGATAVSYKNFKDFNKHVLQKAVKEINNVTDLLVSTDNVKKGRSVVAVKFRVTQKETIIEKEDQFALFPPEEEEGPPDIDDPLALSISALPREFTREQVEVLHNLAIDHMPYEVSSMTEKKMWISDYLQKKVLLMKASGNVEKPYNWLYGAVKDNWQPGRRKE